MSGMVIGSGCGFRNRGTRRGRCAMMLFPFSVVWLACLVAVVGAAAGFGVLRQKGTKAFKPKTKTAN